MPERHLRLLRTAQPFNRSKNCRAGAWAPRLDCRVAIAASCGLVVKTSSFLRRPAQDQGKGMPGSQSVLKRSLVARNHSAAEFVRCVARGFIVCRISKKVRRRRPTIIKHSKPHR
jgi:hypothetical protein